MTIDNALIQSLCQTDQIEPMSSITGYLAQEQRNLYRIHQRLMDTLQPLSPERAYLSLYDCLCRHISIALFNQGYRMSAKQPHQTLRQVARQIVSDTQVKQMIAHRHLLKKNAGSLNYEISITTLIKLLDNYDDQHSQACQILCLLPLQAIVALSASRS